MALRCIAFYYLLVSPGPARLSPPQANGSWSIDLSRHSADMVTAAIQIALDVDRPMMQPHGGFIKFIFDPERHIVDEFFKRYWGLVCIKA